MRTPTLAKELPVILTPQEIYQRLDKYVIGQHKAKKMVAIAAYNHIKRVRAKALGFKISAKKSNILLIGPTGCGKTHLSRTLAQILKLPFVIADATEYTEAGYYGKDVEVMIGELLINADMNIESAQRGIVFLDEVDKIARRSHGAVTGAGSRDIGGEGVQQALLKMLEGRTILVPNDITQHWSKQEYVQIDTTDILFICAGTFSDLHLYSNATKPIGFGNQATGETQKRRITEKDLIHYGMLTEFLGRLPIRVQLDPLTDEEMLAILRNPHDSLVKEYSELLRLDGVSIRFEESGLREIVKVAKKRDAGARALRAVFEDVLANVMFIAPSISGKVVVLDEAFVKAQISDDF